MKHAWRKDRLEALLLAHQHLWRPQPFKIETPGWCADFPALCAELLALDDPAVASLAGDNAALIALLVRHVPELAELAALIELPALPADNAEALGDPAFARGEGLGAADASHPPYARLFTDVPGRKQAQIEAYASALGEPHGPLLEWCAGKGHLGRLLAAQWQQPVASLEIDAALCQAGAELARRAGLAGRQHFIRADALAPDSARHLTGHHAIALHACGDLHTRLVREAAASALPALDITPCCYYRTVHDIYRPFSPTELKLDRDDLRLAVTETVTASPRQQRLSRRALAWKLGWVELRKAQAGETGYRPFPPVPETWLRGTFEEFVARMGERAALDLRAHLPIDLTRFEALGQARAARMLRLQLVRLAFRRPLEVWLLTDMAVHLERHGYRVGIAPFCRPGLTPRNLLLSARKM